MPVGVMVNGPWRRMAVALDVMSRAGTRGAFKPAIERAAAETMEWMLREYTARSKTRSEWPRINWMTYVTSKRRVRSPIRSPGRAKTAKQRLAAHKGRSGPKPIFVRSSGASSGLNRALTRATGRANRSQPLVDRGESRASLIRGHKGNVYVVGAMAARVGTKHPLVVKAQTTRSETIAFTKEVERRLRRNVPPGHRGRWNAFFFFARAVLRKRAKTAAKIPARPLSTTPPVVIVARLQRAVIEILQRGIRIALTGRRR